MTATPTRLVALPRATAAPTWSLDAERWTCASRLMEGLAHDLRNPLNALGLHVEVLKEKLSRAAGGEIPEGPAKNLKALREQVTRLDVLLGQFGRFLSPPGALQGGTPLGNLVRETAAVLGHSARRAQVGLDVDPAEGERIPTGEPSLLRFLVLRLVLRAVDRTPPGGRVRLALAREGGRAVLLVEDGGPPREPTSGPLEEGLAELARTQGAELHHTGNPIRLSFPASRERPPDP